jgi:CRP-like cAMP-binding protein
LTAEDRRSIERLPLEIHYLTDRESLPQDQELAPQFCLILTGYMYSSSRLDKSRRQITSLYVPGDIPDLAKLHLAELCFPISALGSTVVALIPRAAFEHLIARSHTLRNAFWLDTLIHESILRERIVSLGQRGAASRVAHLICEITVRLQMVGLLPDGPLTVPWTQSDIADLCGISPVHANRVLMALRRSAVIDLEAKRLQVRDWSRLAAIAAFSDAFLYTNNKSGQADTVATLHDSLENI